MNLYNYFYQNINRAHHDDFFHLFKYAVLLYRSAHAHFDRFF